MSIHHSKHDAKETPQSIINTLNCKSHKKTKAPIQIHLNALILGLSDIDILKGICYE